MKKNDRIMMLTDKLGRELEINTFESFFLSLNSVNELYIKGCGTIISCSEKELYLKGTGREIHIMGTNLMIQAYTESELLIKGKVRSISFDKEASA